jgi:hypothetical protein
MKTTKLNFNSFIEFKICNALSKSITGGAGSPPTDPPVTSSPPPQGNGDPRPTSCHIFEVIRGTRP